MLHRKIAAIAAYSPTIIALGMIGTMIWYAGDNRIILIVAALFMSSALGLFLGIELTARRARWDRNHKNRRSGHIAALLLISLSASLVLGIAARRTIQIPFTGIEIAQIRWAEGMIYRDSRISGTRTLYMIALERVGGTRIETSAHGIAYCTASEVTEMRWGEKVRIEAALTPISAYNNGTITHYTCRSTSITRQGWHIPLLRYRARLRRHLADRISMMAPRSAQLFRALFIGDRDTIAPEIVQLFRRVGAMHILALSGMHLGIISTLLFLIIRPLFGPHRSIAISAIICICYVAIVGLYPSLVRALVMVCIIGWLKLIRRHVEGINIVALTCIILSLIFPDFVTQLSFQLSFAALSGIMLYGSFFDRKLRPYLPSYIRMPLAASIGAQLATMPFQIFVFKAIYPIGIIAVIFLTPLIVLFLWCGILFLAIADIGIVARILKGILHYLDIAIVGCSRLFAYAPPLRLTNGRTQYVACTIWILLIITLFCLHHTPWRKK